MFLTFFTPFFLQFLLQLPGILAGEDDDELAAGLRLLKMGDGFRQRSPDTLLMDFGNLPTATHLPVLPKDLGKLL